MSVQARMVVLALAVVAGAAPAQEVPAAATPADIYAASARQIIGQSSVPESGAQFVTPPGEPLVPLAEQPYARWIEGPQALLSRIADLARSGQPVVDLGVVGKLAVGTPFDEAATALLEAQIQALPVAPEQFAQAQLAGKELRIGETSLRAILLPGPVKLDAKAADTLKQFAQAGGLLIAWRVLPPDLAEPLWGLKPDAKVEERVVQKGSAAFVPHDLAQVTRLVRGLGADLFLYPPSRDVAFCHRRAEGADVYVIVNTGGQRVDAHATIRCDKMPVVRDLASGQERPGLGVDAQDGHVLMPLDLAPCQAIALVFKDPLSERRVTRAPGLQRASVDWKDGTALIAGWARLAGQYSVRLADGRRARATVTGLPAELSLAGAWEFEPEQAYEREAAQVTELRAAPVETEDQRQYAKSDLDTVGWDVVAPGDPLPFLQPTWHANWLTYQGDGVQKWFRKSFDLADDVRAADVTASVDNGYELFVNGEKVGEDGNWEQAENYDVTGLLRRGKNVLALHATNQGAIAAAIVQARVTLANGETLRILTDGTWKMADAEAEGWAKADFDDSGWGAPTVGDKPPCAPWGNVPGLPPEGETARPVCFRFDLPPGTSRIVLPEWASVGALFVGGEEVPVAGNAADLSGVPAGQRTTAALILKGGRAETPAIQCECAPGQIALGSWTQQGYSRYSGVAAYSRKIRLPREYRDRPLILDLGEVGTAAEVTVNGRAAGVRSMPPYQYDLAGVAKAGENEIKVLVANTLANARTDTGPKSGLIGPVRLIPFEEVQITVR